MPNTMCIPQTPSHPHRLASLGSTYYSQVDMLGVRYKSVNFGANTGRCGVYWINSP